MNKIRQKLKKWLFPKYYYIEQDNFNLKKENAKLKKDIQILIDEEHPEYIVCKFGWKTYFKTTEEISRMVWHGETSNSKSMDGIINKLK